MPVSAPGWRPSGWQRPRCWHGNRAVPSSHPAAAPSCGGQRAQGAPTVSPACPLHVANPRVWGTAPWPMTKPRWGLPNPPQAPTVPGLRCPHSALPLHPPRPSVPAGLPRRGLSQRQRRAVAATSPAVTRAAEPAGPSSGGGRASSPTGAPSPPANTGAGQGLPAAWRGVAWHGVAPHGTEQHGNGTAGLLPASDPPNTPPSTPSPPCHCPQGDISAVPRHPSCVVRPRLPPPFQNCHPHGLAATHPAETGQLSAGVNA